MTAPRAPTATMTASVRQFADTAGAAAMWWKTDVSRTQWFNAPMPPTISTSNDQVSTP